MNRASTLLLAAVLSCSPPAEGGDAGPPDAGPQYTRIIVNTSGIAGAPAGADAVAINGSVIAAVGPERKLAGGCGAGCEVLDAGGAFVSPGFHDAHVHLAIEAAQEDQLDLNGLGVPGAVSALRGWAASHPDAGWLLAKRFSLATLPSLPTKAALDAVDATRPIVVRDNTLHNAWVNSAALAVAGIGAGTPDPPGGVIVRDDAGTPTGVLFDGAASLVQSREPQPSAEQLRAAILEAQRASLAAGFTSAQGGPVTRAQAEAFAALDADGLLVQRTSLWAPLGGDAATFADWVAYARSLPASGKVHITAFKGFLDGTLAARTAALLQPYADVPSTSGALVYGDALLAAQVQRANEAGFPVALHAIGDRAVRQALDAFEASKARFGDDTPQNRVEHVDLVDPADVPRFAALGVVASVQPSFMFFRSLATAPFIGRLGAQRAARAFAWKDLSDSGATLVFGTDFPVGGLSEDPIVGMFCAVKRQFIDGTPFGPEQALEPERALDAYTSAPARIIGSGDRLGRIAPGYEADLVLLRQDPRLAAVMTAASNPVLGVLVAGVPVR